MAREVDGERMSKSRKDLKEAIQRYKDLTGKSKMVQMREVSKSREKRKSSEWKSIKEMVM